MGDYADDYFERSGLQEIDSWEDDDFRGDSILDGEHIRANGKTCNRCKATGLYWKNVGDSYDPRWRLFDSQDSKIHKCK